MNKGLLESSLEMPKLSLFGKEQYPELYQKAAILMETLTKNHCLSDGNKRCGMIAAAYNDSKKWSGISASPQSCPFFCRYRQRFGWYHAR